MISIEDQIRAYLILRGRITKKEREVLIANNRLIVANTKRKEAIND